MSIKPARCKLENSHKLQFELFSFQALFLHVTILCLANIGARKIYIDKRIDCTSESVYVDIGELADRFSLTLHGWMLGYRFE